ncbi:hypothetical protein AN965_16050 [Alkalicoccobacillus plakortidis]|nr:DUF6612 family protein [Shouchella oshimensis]KQL55803.1 hypothetical protein AN965_16050 [Alkalicoccobacillus plakortidis]
MKKMTWLIVAPASTLMLVACGSDETGGEENSSTGTNSNEAVQQGESLSVEEVLTNTEEAMNNVDSFRTEMSMTYDIRMSAEEADETMEFAVDSIMDAISEPLSFKMNTMMTASELGMDVSTDQYFEDGIFYMQNPLGEGWLMMDISDEMELEDELQVDSQEQINMLKDMMTHIEMSEEEDSYVISMEGDNEDFQQFIHWFMEMGGQNEAAIPQEELDTMFENMEVENMTYSLVVDKDTFYQQSVAMSVDMLMEEEGETANFTMDVAGTYSMYNEIESIDIPDEVIENSVDIEEMFGGLEFDETEDDM